LLGNLTSGDTAKYSVTAFTWTGALTGGNFAPVTAYTANLTLNPTADYKYAAGTSATTNLAVGTYPVSNVVISTEASENTLSFKVVFSATAANAISAASVSGLVAPVKNVASGTSVTPGAATYTVTAFTWTYGASSTLASGDNFAASTAYTANITLKANANYKFNAGITPTTNLGTPAASNVSISTEASENTLSFKVVFGATAVATGTGTLQINNWTDDNQIVSETAPVTLSRSGDGKPTTAVINAAAGFTGYKWTLNGTLLTGESGNSYTFDSAAKANGTYNIVLSAEKNTAWYSTIITITVEN
jgi:hypothetical protein